jgi:peptidoglycan/LPS O-acetylase OafA/YrhL
MIKALTSWRGLFALCIVYFHFGMHEFDQMTYAGVSFFFMVSGFLTVLRHDDFGSVRGFYTKRMARIFPLHWLALAWVTVLDLAIIHRIAYSWDFPLHVALLQSWIPADRVFFGYSIHSWFLSTLLMCILATPLLMRLMNRLSLKLIWCVVTVAAMAVVAVNVLMDGELRNYPYVCPATRVVDYCIGMVLALTVKRLNLSNKLEHISLANATLLEIAVLALFAVFITLHTLGNATCVLLENAPIWWLPVALLIVVTALLNGREGLIGKVLTWTPLVWLGGFSFEIYILQKLVNDVFTFVISPIFGHFGILIYGYSMECTVPLLIVVAWCVNRFYTKPIYSLLNRHRKGSAKEQKEVKAQ